METLINLYSTSFIHIFNHLFNISIFKKKIRYPDIKFLISLNFVLIKKKKKKHEITRPFLERERRLKRGVTSSVKYHIKKSSRPRRGNLGNWKLPRVRWSTGRQQQQGTCTSRNMVTGYAGTGFHRGGFEGWFESSWLLGHARCPCT